jgi:hypothetical protein
MAIYFRSLMLEHLTICQTRCLVTTSPQPSIWAPARIDVCSFYLEMNFVVHISGFLGMAVEFPAFLGTRSP